LALFHIDDRQVIRADSLDAFPWVQHGFGTSLSENWPPPDGVLTAKQVHSNQVLIADGETSGVIGEGDALITSLPGTLVAIRTADCLPILIADAGRRAVAAIHAGWRGTVSDISTRTVETLADTFGCISSDLTAVIGPGIGECCFEVGPEVASQFRTLFPDREDLQGRTRISLAEANRRQLQAAGIPMEQIMVVDACTCCGGRRQFHSFRRDRESAGRMVSAIGIVA
jgi:YfiH family protein